MASDKYGKRYLLRMPQEIYDVLERWALEEKQFGTGRLGTVNKIINEAVEEYLRANHRL